MITPPLNIAFTLIIKINGRLKEFNFRKRSDKLYDANTNDEYSIRYYFQLLKEEKDGWQISGHSLPAWIQNSQHIISEALESQVPS
jgi:hypothetical protein